MVHEKDDKPLDLKVIDKWLETFFLDPLTSYLDETAFRIDLFETAEEFIVEALLLEYKKNEVSVFLTEDNILIKALHFHQKNEYKQRIISFPFSIIHHSVKATFKVVSLRYLFQKIGYVRGKIVPFLFHNKPFQSNSYSNNKKQPSSIKSIFIIEEVIFYLFLHWTN